MIREFSAGAVVLRHMKDQWWVAVIEPGREGEPEDRKDIVALPKGNIDAGEKPVQAAVREVREETGIELLADSLEEIGRMPYHSRKDLHLFRVVLHSRNCDIAACKCTSFFPHHASGVMTPEVDQFRWVDITDVPAFAAKSMTALLRSLPGFEAMP